MIRHNPKLASLSVTTVAIAATQIGAILFALSEQSAPDGPRLDRFLSGFILIGAFWTIVAVIDLIRFPTMRMTRLIIGPVFRTAVVITAFQGVFQVVFDMLGGSASSLVHQLTELGVSFIAYWALVSTWRLLREQRTVRPNSAQQNLEAAHQ